MTTKSMPLLGFACSIGYRTGGYITMHKFCILFTVLLSVLLLPGLHGSVLVTNEHSVPAHFQWHAKEGVETDTFFVMHPTGG